MLLLCLGPQAERARQALERGAFEEAYGFLRQEPDDLARARGLAELFYRARDPKRALEAAEAGLDAHPGDLLLRFRATAASLWLRLPERSDAHAARLSRSVEEATLTANERSAWRAAEEGFARDARHLASAERARVRAVRRARWVVAVVFVGTLAWLGALLSLAFREGRAARFGSPRR